MLTCRRWSPPCACVTASSGSWLMKRTVRSRRAWTLPPRGRQEHGHREVSMQSRHHLNALFLVALLGAATAAEAQVTPELAKRYFEEAQKLCERDAGRLWGISLCGPLVIYDPASGTRATNQPEPEGPVPRLSAFADGPVEWGGLRWFAIPLYILPEDAEKRQQSWGHPQFH